LLIRCLRNGHAVGRKLRDEPQQFTLPAMCKCDLAGLSGRTFLHLSLDTINKSRRFNNHLISAVLAYLQPT